MNGPHTHKVKISGRPNHGGFRYYRIEYGDTQGYCMKWPPRLERRLRGRTERVIRKHDRGSIRAQQDQDFLRSIERPYHEFVVQESTDRWSTTMVQAWGSDLIHKT